MWDPWRKPSVLLVHFFVTIFTITSSIVTMTPTTTTRTSLRLDYGLRQRWEEDFLPGRGEGGAAGGIGRGGGNVLHLPLSFTTGNMSAAQHVEHETAVRPLLGISSSSSASSPAPSAHQQRGDQRIASSSRLGIFTVAVHQNPEDYVMDRNVATTTTTPSYPILGSSAKHRIDFLTGQHSSRTNNRDDEQAARGTWSAAAGNEHGQQRHSVLTALFELGRERGGGGRSGDGRRFRRQGNDSINLSWSVLNNASTTIGHGHATLPDPSSASAAASGGMTNIIINRNNSLDSVSTTSSNSSSHREDDSASSKVIESRFRRSNSTLDATAIVQDGDEWREGVDDEKNDSSNRDNGVAFGKITNPSSSRRGSSSSDSHALSASAVTAENVKWTDQSGASTTKSRRRETTGVGDENDDDVGHKRPTTSSSGQSTATLIESRMRIALQSESILAPPHPHPPAQLTSDDDSASPLDVEEGSLSSSYATRNTISEDDAAVRDRTAVRRPNDGTATNAKLIAAANHGEKTFVHNNITRGTTIISRNDTVPTTTSSSSLPPPQHHRSAVAVAGVVAAAASSGATTGARNKTATHNSIRTLNHISDRKPYFGKHHHNNDKYGPHFEDIKTVGNVTNMTVQMGQSVYLNCRISLLQDKTVSWMRRLVGENELQLLTVGNHTYSGDSRYAVHYQYPHNWRLKITKPQVDDEGTYECQISTHPPRVIQYNLHINAPKVMIIDEAGLPLQDKYYEVDSTIQLSCIVRDVKMATSVVYWNHSDQILNYDITRGGISVKTDLMGTGANSTILVARVNKSDSGNYSCSISPDQFYTVTVHVLNGESYAELHHGNGTTIHRCWSTSLLWAYGLLLSLLHILINAHDRDFNSR